MIVDSLFMSSFIVADKTKIHARNTKNTHGMPHMRQ